MIANLLIDYFQQGGPMMWPILLALLLAMTVARAVRCWWMELSWGLRMCAALACFDAITNGQFEKALSLSDVPADPLLMTVRQGLLHAHVSLLGAMQLAPSEEIKAGERLQWILGTLITLAPLLGLLGTITGIMRSFNFVGDDQLAATKVSGGIAEALIATACGLASPFSA